MKELFIPLASEARGINVVESDHCQNYTFTIGVR